MQIWLQRYHYDVGPSEERPYFVFALCGANQHVVNASEKAARNLLRGDLHLKSGHTAEGPDEGLPIPMHVVANRDQPQRFMDRRSARRRYCPNRCAAQNAFALHSREYL